MVRCPLKTAFFAQRMHSRERGIEFKLTFEQWRDWWGEDIKNRGRGSDKLQMCRINDEGCYEVGNIFKATHAKNLADSNMKKGHKPKALTDEEVAFVKLYLNHGYSTRNIAKLFNTSQKTIMRVKLEKESYGY